MESQTPTAQSRHGWRWVLVLLFGAAWLSIGCSPQTLSMFLMPFTDNNVAPEHKLFADSKEITLAILSNFGRLEARSDAHGSEVELAELTMAALKKRCADNKHRIKFIADAQVRSQVAKLRQQTGGEPSAVEVGKNLKADYVLELTIDSFSLYEKIAFPPMYHGRANLAINLYKTDAKGGEHKVFGKEYARVHPRDTGPFDASSMSVTMYRTRFLMAIADDLSKIFIGYPPEERRKLE
ncbi:MAG: hypothetical protein HYR84_15010 [Planctomycetes bacterium]|nr:hypothetical protein [Planctomycetota bacterium]